MENLSIPTVDFGLEYLEPQQLKSLQLQRLQQMVNEIIPGNLFYTRKLDGLKGIGSWEEFSRLPFTTKSELMEDQLTSPIFGTNLTYPVSRYIKLHQTSGTSGKEPIRWLDTAQSWQWWRQSWARVLNAASVNSNDRVFFPFSFGPFIGFWAGFEAVDLLGAMSLPGGGMNTQQRIGALVRNQATVICCTPTYALHMAEVAKEMGIDLSDSLVSRTIHAGEPGASLPTVRQRIEKQWGAKCFDHTGMTELGPTGFSCEAKAGVHLMESEFIFEVIDPKTTQILPPGTQGELVATNLGRLGSPLIRYRTGDSVIIDQNPCSCGRTFARMVGGILGRVDDMLIVKGVNVFPSSIEQIVRQFEDVSEFRIEVRRINQMDELTIIVESLDQNSTNLSESIAQAVDDQLLLRVNTQIVPPGTLPHPELKAQRVSRIEE